MDGEGGGAGYNGRMPDTPLPAPLTDEEIETRLLAAAVREAMEESDDQLIPHELVRAWMLEEIEALQRRIDEIVAE